MTSRLRALGGRINNIRTSELPKEKTRSEVVCSIRFLDGLVQTFKANKQDTGQVLLDMAYNHLGVTEKEYFGLQHGDDSVDSVRWLESSKPIRKQLKGGFPCTLHFRVRFFIPDPNTLQEEQTRHLYFLQLKMDICEGRLTCPLNSAVVLASYAVQCKSPREPFTDGQTILTDADTCIPKLNEGDQIVLINGRDISEHTHDQVVMFIKASRESHTRELALVIRRKAVHSFADIKSEDELNQLFPEAIFPICPEGGDTLEGSMEQLKKGLESGTVLIQFEQLYRKKPGLAITFAKLPQNLDKNRYKDVLPYDTTRVLLQGNEDYINASYVNMEIPAANLVNKYIAAQGPLPHTCAQFWQVVWDQKLSLIVMLTTLTERGRTKCHQYWPDPPDVMEHGNFHIRCQSEDCTIAYVFREMLVTNTETGEEHTVTHLQYVAWPDHGVPDDSSDFLEFVNSVRSLRVGGDPVLVHCSAGIGRTGVLVTMETAICLIERNLPVYPLDVVRKMRDQRAMMVQTSSQYKFVCEAILRVYEEGLVQMLDPS
ncbi:tyrosine-protein phosphatase non-receptor type 3 [Leptonychotes weddellii]|uniref:Tyrosine-protein phosphatase non-receptor type 3 n=1 Tax=Leptonychotes weddellii TaxID=9713 RepID=A0A7F8R204_LEPWE|nr:tyrosine-protein phosphatase non-receptor type 3 [Leptonychotes weddellii]